MFGLFNKKRGSRFVESILMIEKDKDGGSHQELIILTTDNSQFYVLPLGYRTENKEDIEVSATVISSFPRLINYLIGLYKRNEFPQYAVTCGRGISEPKQIALAQIVDTLNHCSDLEQKLNQLNITVKNNGDDVPF